MVSVVGTDHETLPKIQGYTLVTQIYLGSRTAVYRATEDATGRSVVIKLLQQAYPSFYELLQFRNQYSITANLEIPGIIRPYALEAYGNSYALVMEDAGGISLRDYAQTHSLSITEILEIALKLATTLNQLHQARIIHKDIKPANILIRPETQEIYLIDFSIASLLSKEIADIKNPNQLEGTLAYLSPEQTGRMNRGVDYRSDFYSLGVTLYELLTGQLPFQPEDPLELVHCHIAKSCKPADQVNFKIPRILSEIIAKLMAKNAEARYQSALGLHHDLQICLDQFTQSGQIDSFTLGVRDRSDRFTIPEKLYGREAEVETLLASFERVALGRTELMLIAGFSGIGKTAVINEVHKPMTRQKGYFIKGKYDQFNRNVPLSAFVQAFRDLILQLLSESDTKLQHWRSQILAAIGEAGQVLIEVIPELERLIGVQPAVEILSGMAAQQRFNRLFQKFVQVFTNPQHPLIIFLDDLQWADNTSLKLLQLLMEDAGHLLILGAYRDNEVSSIHPFIQTVDELLKNGRIVNTITLQPLDRQHTNQLIAETLGCDTAIAQPLTELVEQKTKGNPFFTTQFLKGLYQEHYIRFNATTGVWECDIAQVRSAALTDDVVAFMVQQLQKLPELTQIALQRAACIGAQFDLKTLAVICEQLEHQVATILWPAIQAGLILPISETYKFFQVDRQDQESDHFAVPYKFLHDRVQQAAYALIAVEQKSAVHRTIGQLLLQNTPESELEEQIFNIVNQLNQGNIEHGFDLAERQTIANLNLTAARKARQSTAYSTALSYAQIGISHLATDCWQIQYSSALALHTIATESAYLSGDFSVMKQWANIALPNCETSLDQVAIQEFQILAYVAQGKTSEAITLGLQTLQKFGVDIPAEPTEQNIQQALQLIAEQLAEVGMDNLLDLPMMENAEVMAALRILIAISPVSFLVNPSVWILIALTEVQLSLQYGNSPFSPIGYISYSIILIGVLNDIDAGCHFSNLSLALCQKYFNKAVAAQVYCSVSIFVSHWKQHLRESLPIVRQGSAYGLEAGEFDFTSWGYFQEGIATYLTGQELSTVEKLLQNRSLTMQTLQQFIPLAHTELFRQYTLNLLGRSTGDTCTLAGDAFDEATGLAQFQEMSDKTGLFRFHLYKLMLCYQFECYEDASNYAEKALSVAVASVGQNAMPLLYLYTALAQLAQYDPVTTDEQANGIDRVNGYITTLQAWAIHAPMNYQHYVDLIEAEQCRCLKQNSAAIELYDRSIAGAKENGFIQDEALANELAAKFYLAWGKQKVAAGYLQEAYYCYSHWGAKAKIDDLEKRYPLLLEPILRPIMQGFNPLETLATMTSGRSETIAAPHRSIHATVESSQANSSQSSTSGINATLDFAAILKASQSLAGTLQLDELLHQVTQIILQNSGGDRCALILPNENSLWQVRAITNIDKTELCTAMLEGNLTLPTKLIQYVKNSQEIVVMDNLKTDLPIVDDYLTQHHPKSLLCLPILNQSKLIGILYLENRLASGVFTGDRVLILNFLCTQAAMSLENARLYQQSQTYVQQLEQSQLQIIQSEKMSALGNLVAGVAHEINNPVGCIIGNVGATQGYIQDLLGLVDLYMQNFPQPGADIEVELETIELEYLRQDLPKLIQAMKDSGKRIKSISQSLRTFSRADTDAKQPFNLHEGIDSTVLILRHRLKANSQRPEIQINHNYGNLQTVDCFPGQLNQVFMNILANAIDVFDEMAQIQSYEEIEVNPQKITISTQIIDNQVQIQIADNGKGMPEEIRSRIFDHLFTTKGVGQGTGLGLSIARQIIEEKHSGTIEVNSVVGQGTTFAIFLPIPSIN